MKKYFPLWFVIFVSFFCYSSMLTMFVPLLQDKNSPLYIISFTASHRNILSGLYLSLYPLGQFLGAPIIGALSDKFGRKKILIISLLLTTLCLLLIGYAVYIKSLILLAAGCFICGLGESNMAIALSAIADLTTIDTRSTAFAKAWVMCSLGYILGSMFGGVAALVGYVYPFLIEAILVIATCLTVILLFTDKVMHQVSHSLKNTLLTFARVFSKNDLRQYYFGNFLSYIACFGILRVELIYMQEYFQLNQLQIAIFYSYASIIAMIANFVVTPFLLRKTSISGVILFAGIAGFISSIIFIIPNDKIYLWLTTGLIGLFIPIILAMTGALISTQAPVEQQGAVMGNNQSLQVLAEAVSAIIGGLIFSLNHQLPFITFTIIGMFSLTIYKYLKH